MSRFSIRWRLTAWYAAVLALVLALFGGAVYLTVRQQSMQRIDQGLREELADVRFEVQRAEDEPGLLIWLHRRFGNHAGFDFQIKRPEGETVFINERLRQGRIRFPDAESAAAEPHFRTVELSDDRYRVISIRQQGPRGLVDIQVARSLEHYDRELARLLFVLVSVGPLVWAAAIGGGYFLARRALRPVQQITTTAEEITATSLERRIPIVNPNDELGALAGTLNGMISRLETSFREMQRFTADAAHELRTPLAVLRSEAEVALRAPRTGEEYVRILETLLEEITRISEMADQLLFLCRYDAGLQLARRDSVAVDSLLEEVVANMQLVAEAKGIRLSFSGACPTEVLGDAGQLRRAVYNLLDNAIKYTNQGGSVAVTSAANHDVIQIAIADTGIGIPVDHLPRIFDRFYRVDPARNVENGTGLGLSICRSIIHGMGGAIHVESRIDQGSRFVITLPPFPACKGGETVNMPRRQAYFASSFTCRSSK